VVHFDRIIPPGGKGTVSLKVNLAGLKGDIKKSARIYTNDPTNSTGTLAIKAFVRIPIEVSTQRINLSGNKGTIISRSVTITANGEKPLELEVKNLYFTKMVTYQLDEIDPGKKFKVTLKNLPDAEGTIKGVLTLKTNYPEKPEITITITGKFQDKITKTDKS
jgi:hypothetical protein